MEKIPFNFADVSNGIERCIGYVKAKVEIDGRDKVYVPVDVVIKKLVAKNPDWKKVGRLAIENAI